MATEPHLEQAENAHLEAEAARSFPTVAEKQYPLEPSLIDARRYTDPELHEREIREIFFKSWFPACPSIDLKAPRDYVVWDRLRQSIVLARQDDGSVSAWHNVCQHRGARLLKESGSCPAGRFSCPWHGFQYDLDGKVRFVPLKGAFEPERLENLRAPAVRVEEYAGFVWICLSDEVADLKTYLGGIGEELDFYGLDRFETRYRFQMELNANWKVVVDAFNETWHVPFTHPRSLGHFVQWRDAHLRLTPPHSWMTLPLKGFTEKFGPEVDHRLKHICHYLAFPNTIFSCFPTHLQTWNIWPIDVDRTLFTAWGVVGPTPAAMTEEEWTAQNDRDWKHFCAVSAEDAEVLNEWGSVSRSLATKQYMFNTAESRLTAFHEEVARRAGGLG
jgi:phenylpropionate dioxygenase-like ring-hydroxylating dioxygenase large terminal subunit